jgi:uncharacterized damage-inducible protein DinB
MCCHLRYDAAGNVIETHEHAGEFERAVGFLTSERVGFLSSRRFTFCMPVASRIATIRCMHRLCILLLLFSPSVSVVAQTPANASPSPAPATLRSLLLSELHSTHDKAEWFTPMNTAVAGLTAEQAKWVPKNAQGKLDPNANHSVGMLAHHLVFWNENTLARLHGEKPANPSNNDETFNAFDAAQWNDIVQRLDRVMKDLEAEVEKMPEEKLPKVASTISHISTHNAYHTGQILYVRKLQGSWNPANGVK